MNESGAQMTDQHRVLLFPTVIYRLGRVVASNCLDGKSNFISLLELFDCLCGCQVGIK